jgi:TNF receptor-associated protein 1
VARMPEAQKEIYFLPAATREAALASPDYEVFRERKWEVLFLEDPRDEFVLEHLGAYEGKTLVAASRADVALEQPETPAGALDAEASARLSDFLKSALGDRVGAVRSSQRLVGSPVAVRESDGALSASMRRMLQRMGREEGGAQPLPDLEINPQHPIILRLDQLSRTDEALARQLGEQLLDNALVAAGLIEDPKVVLGRLHRLLERLLEKNA